MNERLEGKQLDSTEETVLLLGQLLIKFIRHLMTIELQMRLMQGNVYSQVSEHKFL